jgi:Domain of unknown function (DUF222)
METATLSRSVADGLVAALDSFRAAMPETEFGLSLAQWEQVRFDCSVAAGCTVGEASAGLVVLEGVRRSLDAVTAVLASRLNAGRDTRAALVRKTGMSSRQATEIVDIVKVFGSLPGSEELLSAGKVSVAHLRPLAHINSELASSVLADAEGMGADQFVTFVKERNVKRNAKSVAEEQEASRSVTFFETKNGCVGARIVLPVSDGTEFRETLNQLCDTQYKKDHPERAEQLGGHDVEPRERRLADAFRTWLRNHHVGAGRPAVIVTIDAETLDAMIIPNRPISFAKAVELAARGDLYTAIRQGTKRAQLVFGRNRRLASPLQRLALMALQPTCVWDGCNESATRCEVDHQVDFDSGGDTDIGNLRYLCPQHHRHRHLEHVDVYEQPDGTWKLRPTG